MKKVYDKPRALLLAFIFGWTLVVVPSFATRAAGGQTTTATRASRPPAAAAQQPIRVPQLPAQQPTPQATPQATPQPTPTPQTPAATPARTPDASRLPASELGPPPKPVNEGSTDKPVDETIIDEDEVVRVTSNLVVVPVSVTNEAGEPLQGLKATDFRLEEEGRAQEIAQVGDAEQVPLDIAILFDVSSSIGQRFAFEQEAAARFLKQVLKPIDRAAVFAIEGTPRLEQQLSSAEIASAKLLQIPAPTKSTPTAFYDATIAAARYLAQNAPGRHRRVIVVVSDGEDNFSEMVKAGEAEDARALLRGEKLTGSANVRQQATHRKALVEVQREVQRADAVFYSINPSGGGLQFNARGARAQAGMQQLAATTGGTSFAPEQLEQLDDIFRRIAAELRAQYLLQYYSNSDAPNGKFLNIKVRTPTRTDARVRARSGYYVKK
ncbi:MAG: Ca-activated chloride channel [Pyrinomonadaceae bacterium]|nr:Ca-activated chloride channel [Pyrinomonadaceae bacterium]